MAKWLRALGLLGMVTVHLRLTFFKLSWHTVHNHIRHHPRLTAFIAIAMAVAWASQSSAAAESPGQKARFSADGRALTITAHGFDEFRATWSATVQRDGSPERVLASTEGTVTPGQTTTIRFPDESVELLFQLEPHTDAPAVMVRADIRNTGITPVKLLSATPAVAE